MPWPPCPLASSFWQILDRVHPERADRIITGNHFLAAASASSIVAAELLAVFSLISIILSSKSCRPSVATTVSIDAEQFDVVLVEDPLLYSSTPQFSAVCPHGNDDAIRAASRAITCLQSRGSAAEETWSPGIQNSRPCFCTDAMLGFMRTTSSFSFSALMACAPL